jgi:hypothetical protein
MRLRGKKRRRGREDPSDGIRESGIPRIQGADDARPVDDAAPGRWRLVDPERVTVYTQAPASFEDLLARIGPLGTGETFCAMDPDSGDAVSATISDTVATFVIQVTQDPAFGALPAAVAASGWDAAKATAYEISVANDGPGGQRLRYRLAKGVLEAVGEDGVIANAAGNPVSVDSLADATWGSLW